MQRKVRQHTFCGVRYDIDIYNPYAATCDPPHEEPCRRIALTNGIKYDRETLELLIHESLHACNWPATEAKVEDTAHDIAKFLWRIGYRLE